MMELTEDLLRCQSYGADPGDGLGALLKVLHELHEENAQTADHSEHQHVADKHGAYHHPAIAPILWSLWLGLGLWLQGLVGLRHGYREKEEQRGRQVKGT